MKQQQEEIKRIDDFTLNGELSFCKDQIANIANENLKVICRLLLNKNNFDLKENIKIIEEDLCYLNYSKSAECDKELIDILLNASQKWKNDYDFQECKDRVWSKLKIYLESVNTDSCEQQVKKLQKIYN